MWSGEAAPVQEDGHSAGLVGVRHVRLGARPPPCDLPVTVVGDHGGEIMGIGLPPAAGAREANHVNVF